MILERSYNRIPGGDNTTYAFAGLSTGLLYKSTAGIRGAMLAGALGAVGSLAYMNGSTFIYNYLSKDHGRF